MLKNRFLTIFVCIFSSVVLVFGATLGIIAGVKSARAVVSYDNVRVEAGALRYFSAYYKGIYINALKSAGVNADNTKKFWDSIDESGKTQREIYTESFEEYIRSLVAACSIYLTNSSYTKDDKNSVKRTVEELLRLKAGGSVEKFNSMTEKYGFDYDDFCSAAELMYKAERAKTVIYGTDGQNLANFPKECAKYLDTYSHVSLLFVRTEEVFVVDEEGNYVYGDDGAVLTREMTDEEKAERQEIIDKLTAAMEARENGTNGQITPEMFEIYLEKSNGDPDMYKKGYYFNENASYTNEFAEKFPEVVECALEMELYDYKKVDCYLGVCFIYKYDVAEGAYSDSDDLFFSDFYADASNYLYPEVLKTYAPEIKIKDSFYEVDYSEFPSLSAFVISEWK